MKTKTRIQLIMVANPPPTGNGDIFLQPSLDAYLM